MLRRLKLYVTWRTGLAIALLFLSGLVVWLLRRSDADILTMAGLEATLEQAGAFGPLIYIGVLALSVVISHIPGVPLAMAAGMIWGPLLAGVYSVIGGFLGAMIAYFLGYFIGRPVMKVMTGKVLYFSAERGHRFIGWLIFITRLLPILSFDLISYAAGMTGVPLPIYCTATLLGMIPSTLLLTYLGSFLIVSPWVGIAFTSVFLIILVGLPWGIQTYNWFNLKNIIHYE